jgi:hypothetical protein
MRCFYVRKFGSVLIKNSAILFNVKRGSRQPNDALVGGPAAALARDQPAWLAARNRRRIDDIGP